MKYVTLTLVFVHEVCEQTASHRLVTDHHDILLTLQLHDDWLETTNQVLIRLHKQTYNEITNIHKL